MWCAMVSSDAEAGGARVGKPSPLPFFATTPSPLCLAASQQRIEEQQQRGAGLLLSLAASAALVFGAGPASADVKLPPLDNGAHVFQHDDEESVLWTWLAQMPPHHARRDVRRAGRPLERRAAQPASALPPQTRTAASAATWGTPSGRPTRCPTSPWTCASASTRGTTSAARRCRVRRRAALVADWPHAAPAHCQPTPICVHEPLWLRTRFLSQVKSSQPLLLLCAARGCARASRSAAARLAAPQSPTPAAALPCSLPSWHWFLVAQPASPSPTFPYAHQPALPSLALAVSARQARSWWRPTCGEPTCRRRC